MEGILADVIPMLPRARESLSSGESSGSDGVDVERSLHFVVARVALSADSSRDASTAAYTTAEAPNASLAVHRSCATCMPCEIDHEPLRVGAETRRIGKA